MIKGWADGYRYCIILAACLAAGLLGAWAIYPMLIAMVASVLVLLALRQLPWLSDDMATKVFVVSFAFYAASFIASASDVQDVIFILNYSPLLLFAPLVKIMRNGARPGNDWRFALAALLGVAILALWASYQKYGLGIRRPEGLEVDTIAYAHTALILGVIASVGVFTQTAGWRWLFLLGPVLGVAVTMMTSSRGPLLAAPVLLVIVLIAWIRRPLVSIAASIGIAAMALTAVWAFTSDTFSRIETIADNFFELITEGQVDESSSHQRIEMHTAGWQAFLEAPLAGHGWEQKFDAVAPYLDEASRILRRRHHHLHSDPVDVAVTNGIIGLIGYALVLLAPLAGALFSPKDTQYVSRLTMSTILSVGYAIFGLTYLLFGYEYHTTLYVVLAAIVLGFCRDPDTDRAGHAS